ncbi:hypothetical protein R1flu_011386 [Riccia fluitans]|uniref:Uncharacterized protein n=1 Tax=Riccia fluitans TaxID=41844 RepID=A0ABD1Z7N2_9MARC
MAEEEVTEATEPRENRRMNGGSPESNLRQIQDEGLVADGNRKADENTADISSGPSTQNKNVDVETIKLAYEKRLEALKQQLRVRDSTMNELAEENESLTRALSELKGVVKETMTERERLADRLKQQQKTLQTMQASLREADAEVAGAQRDVSEAKREAADAKKELNDARREATEASVALADAKAEVWAVREAAKGKALGEDERRELEGALRALSSSSQRAAQEASQWKEKASQWKGRTESLTEELENKAKALASVENELALAQQFVKDAQFRIQEAQHSQQVAENALDQLQHESDLRAQRFNAAVKAAVGKIQSDLERERDIALQRIEALEVEADGQATSLKEANEAVSAAMKDVGDLATRIGELENEKRAGEENLSKLQEQVDYWKTTAETADKRADAACEVTESLTNKVVKLEARCEELIAESDSCIRNAAVTEASLKADISRLKSQVAALQNEKQLLQMESSEKILKATAQQITLRARISELEGLSRSLRTESVSLSAGSGLKVRQGLDNLGLEGVREERLQRKDKYRFEDVEKNGDKKASKSYGQSSSSSYSFFPNSWTWLQESQDSLPRGHLSRRSVIVLIYIVLLHIMVMVSFTQRSQNCVDLVGEALGAKLPGR